MQQQLQQPQNQHTSVRVPDAFLCPISHDIMTDPVIGKDGYSYEKTDIINWIRLKTPQKSPMNPAVILIESELVSNRALKEQIAEFKLVNPIYHIGPNIATKQSNTNAHVVPQELENLTLDSHVEHYNNTLFVTLVPTSMLTRMPVHVVCVVDISGSMDTEVEIINETGTKENNGLSRLDITKHGLKTIINAMTPSDYITLITFSDAATVLAIRKNVSTINKVALLEQVENMKPSGSTNIWDGLRQAIQIIESTTASTESNAVFLLTDGEPQIEPPRGHETMLTKAMTRLGPKCTVNTFGFTYGLNSKLLYNLAQIGQGSYAFIPDAGFVGTIFINALANLFLTCAIQCAAKVNYSDGTSEVTKFGSCMLQNKRTLCLNLNTAGGKVFSNLELSYTNPITHITNTIVHDSNTIIDVNALTPSRIEMIISKTFVDLLRDMVLIPSVQIAQNNLKLSQFITELTALQTHTNLTNAILADAKGQVSEACSKPEWFTKWGRHYLLSLATAHSLQQCNNFKDPGVQQYANARFDELREQLDDIFNNMAPPKPTKINTVGRYVTGSTRHVGFANTGTNYSQVSSMASYNNTQGGCFAGECEVFAIKGSCQVEPKTLKMGDCVTVINKRTKLPPIVIDIKNLDILMTIKQSNNMQVWKGFIFKTQVKSVEIGDFVVSKSSDGKITLVKVTHVVKILTPNGVSMVELKGGCKLTHWHPIYDHNTNNWTFAINSQNKINEFIYNGEAMYDFVLESNHTILVNSSSCVTLGHDFVGPVVGHNYFGSSKIVEDINKLNNTECTKHTGYVVITQDYFHRDQFTNRINNISKPIGILNASSNIDKTDASNNITNNYTKKSKKRLAEELYVDNNLCTGTNNKKQKHMFLSALS